jgi:hypothetical protein
MTFSGRMPAGPDRVVGQRAAARPWTLRRTGFPYGNHTRLSYNGMALPTLGRIPDALGDSLQTADCLATE